MRHIPLRSQTPDTEWLRKASELLDKLKEAPSAEARHEIIANNSSVWGALKPWLQTLSHGKCWFSEARDCFSHWDVEHYRPKSFAKDADGTSHEGYWWLAFDWQNLRICGNAGNRKKGTFFPLRDGCARCTPLGDHRHEAPALLDPADEDDPVLLSFDIEGRAIVAAYVTDEWEKQRVECSVQRYNLDFPPLMDKRKVVWSECWHWIQEYLKELEIYHQDPTNMLAREAHRRAAERVRQLMNEKAEFSAVARACVLGAGDPRLAGLLQSA